MFKKSKIVNFLIVLAIVLPLLAAVALPVTVNDFSVQSGNDALSGIVDFQGEGSPQAVYDTGLDSVAVNWGSVRQAVIVIS